MNDDHPSHRGFAAVDAARAYGGKFYDSAEDFNATLDHVLTLLEDAVAF